VGSSVVLILSMYVVSSYEMIEFFSLLTANRGDDVDLKNIQNTTSNNKKNNFRSATKRPRTRRLLVVLVKFCSSYSPRRHRKSSCVHSVMLFAYRVGC